MKVVIDPGHGGTEEVGGSSPNNATGPTGLLEKTVTLDVARRIKSAANDLDIVLTRSTDTNLGLAARAKVAKDLKAPVFVSVHFNGWPTQEVQGTETYVHASGSADSLGLARTVQAKVLAIKEDGKIDLSIKALQDPPPTTRRRGSLFILKAPRR